jgi:hypothetical protein
MKEWFKKYLGWVGFGVWVAFTLIGFCFMAGVQTIQGILNEEYFTKYSEKVKNGIIVFLVATTIVIFPFLLLVL